MQDLQWSGASALPMPNLHNQKTDDRVSTIKRIGNCLNCLRSGHVLKHCTSSSTAGNVESSTIRCSITTTAEEENIRSNTSSNFHRQLHRLLKTAVVDIEDSSGNKKPCRVLLDDGSESSFMTDSCAKSLGLQREKTNVYITGISGSTNAHAKWKINVRIFSQVNDSFVDVESLILPKVTGTLPRLPCDPTSWSHLRDIRLADPHFCEPGDVDLLLGADVVALIMREGRRQGPLHTPIAQQQIQIRSHVATCNLRNFSEILGNGGATSSATLTPEEAQCEAHFVSTHSRLPDGRYMVRLPFKKDMKQIGDTRQQAVQRLFHLERRFKTYPHHHQEYIKFMREYESLGHMELVTYSTAANNPIVYLPHHFVIKADSTTQTSRVFDGSAKSSTGVLSTKLSWWEPPYKMTSSRS
ncbi:hypothetical protein Ocin01_19500 [Orchesella cincta]|uniref:Uncharacterized protein n=1 Tax=Orchesella cincta TaxID=48709 RepID=A0A1D2M2L5_ORCCI|nr:hypothetical protein Ocin01_19500 [Orchesella cincta]